MVSAITRKSIRHFDQSGAYLRKIDRAPYSILPLMHPEDYALRRMIIWCTYNLVVLVLWHVSPGYLRVLSENNYTFSSHTGQRIWGIGISSRWLFDVPITLWKQEIAAELHPISLIKSPYRSRSHGLFSRGMDHDNPVPCFPICWSCMAFSPGSSGSPELGGKVTGKLFDWT